MFREKNGYTTTSKITAPYKRVKKQPVSIDERRREKATLKSYNIYTGGGNDIA